MRSRFPGETEIFTIVVFASQAAAGTECAG